MRLLLRRLLLISGAVLVFAVLYNLYGLIGTTTNPKHLVLQGAYTAQLVQQAQPLAAVRCPDVPIQQGPVLDFCSPKDHGDVAGPYGAHIVLASENLSANPDTWVLVKKNQPITDPVALSACVSSKHGCFAIHAPNKLGNEQSKTLYAFTWSGSAFPTQTGDYYIEALTGNISHPNQLQLITSTPVSFTLLTSQAPCISLVIANGKSTDCNGTSHNFQVQLTGISPTSLTIKGTNWLLGWQTNSVNETVEITATCPPPQQCGRNPLFDVKTDVDASGTFNISVPLPVSGKYTVSAVNHVPLVFSSQQSDYTPSNDNSIADGALTFGTSMDSISLTMDVLPPLVATPTPVFRRVPTATPRGNGGGSENISASRLELYALTATLPAFIGIIVFFLILVYQRRLALGLAPSFVQHATFSSSAHQQTERKENVPVPLAVNFILNEAPFLPFPPTAAHPQFPVKPPSTEKNAKQKIEQALKQWQQREKLTKAQSIAPSLLWYDFASWETFCEQLSKPSVKYRLDSQEMKTLQNHADNALRVIQQPGAKDFLGLVSKALVRYVVLLSLTDSEVMYHAAMQYLIGFTYVLLALHTSYPGDNLLQAARSYYTSARDLVNNNYSEDTTIQDFLSIIFVAIGDVNVAMAQLSQSAPEADAKQHLAEALNVYNQALNVTVTPSRQQMIQSRLIYVENQIGLSRR